MTLMNRRTAISPTALAALFAAVGFAAAYPAAIAQAAACASFYADSGNNDIIVGQATTPVWYVDHYEFISTGDLAVCWKDTSGAWNYVEYSGCNETTSASDYFFVEAGGGNDRLGPATTGAKCLGTNATYIQPFQGDYTYAFGFYAYMGTGADIAYGTQNADRLFSNAIISFTYPADSAEDTLCGYSGSDTLSGDLDDSDAYEEILVGGASSGDTCFGGDFGAYYDWASDTCETITYAYTTTSNFSCGTAAPNLWP